MNTKTMYSELYRIRTILDPLRRESVPAIDACYQIDNFLSALREEILISSRGGSAKTQAAAAKRLLRNAWDKLPDPATDALGRQYIVSRYFVTRLDDAVLPMPEDAKRVDVECGSVYKLLTDFCADSMRELQLPNVADLRLYIREKKATGIKSSQVAYDFGADAPACSAEYLLSIMELLPDCRAYVDGKNNAMIHFFTSGDDRGILMAIRKKQ